MVNQYLLQETDNCPSWISGRERMTVKNVTINLHERMLPASAGFEAAASWSPVGRASEPPRPEYLSPRFEQYHKSDLNDNLRRFFASIRCKLGTNVKTSPPDSYKSGISAIILKIGLDRWQHRPWLDCFWIYTVCPDTLDHSCVVYRLW